MSNIKLDWLRHVTADKDKDRIRTQVKATNDVIVALNAIVDRRVADVVSRRLDKKDYSLAGWAYLQAELNGEEKALTEIRNLIPN